MFRSSVWAATTSGGASTSPARAQWSTLPWTPASRSSTRPTSTAAPRANPSSDAPSRAAATASCWRRSSECRGDHPELAGGAAPAYVRKAVEGSLRRLRTDRIDLYQLHEPRPETPIDETLGALADLVAEGKVREIGCSNFTADLLREADGASSGPVRFVSVQNELNVLDDQDVADGLAEAERLGLAYLPYYPLASGVLTGKYRRGGSVPDDSRLKVWFDDDERAEALAEDRLRRVEALAAFAEGTGRTILDLAFGWLLAHDAVASVIAGATTPDQVRANAAAGAWIPDAAAFDAMP